MTIIERILEEAERKNIKQVTIAKTLNKGTAQITSWKERNCNPPAEYIPIIAALLNVSIEWLMTGKEKEQENEFLKKYNLLPKQEQEEIIEIMEIKLRKIKTI